MIINLSNHPYHSWTELQKEAAREYGSVTDLSFPAINPDASEGDVSELALLFLEKIEAILSKSADSVNVVHLMGEMTFSFHLASKLIGLGITCLASTTSREVVQTGETKTSVFRFCRFRRYVL